MLLRQKMLSFCFYSSVTIFHKVDLKLFVINFKEFGISRIPINFLTQFLFIFRPRTSYLSFCPSEDAEQAEATTLIQQIVLSPSSETLLCYH